MKMLESLQKLRCKIQNVKKVGFFLLFWEPCGNSFILQNCIHLRKQPYWITETFVVEGIQRSDP